jgi:hypothetical protein
VSMSRLGRRAGQIVGLVAAAAVLAGCGEIHPGVAVKAGDETISVSDVDQTVADFCEAIEPELQADGQVVPMLYYRGGIAGVLAQRIVADQLAAEYDVEPGALYEQTVADLRANLRTLDEDVLDAVITLQSASSYIEGVQAAVGEQLLAEEGADQPKYSEKVARGKQAYEQWVSDNGVTFDPQFGVEMVKSEILPVDTSVSYAAGDNAKAGSAEAPDPTYARSLPSPHSCG